MLLMMVPDQYPNYYKAVEIYTGYFNSPEGTDGRVVRAGISVTWNVLS